MRRRTIATTIGAAIAATAIAGGAVAMATGGDDGEETVTGSNADKAAAAAVAETGGKVSGVEPEDDGSAGWEVEVTKDDGSEIEVHVATDFSVSSVESDDDSGTEADDD